MEVTHGYRTARTHIALLIACLMAAALFVVAPQSADGAGQKPMEVTMASGGTAVTSVTIDSFDTAGRWTNLPLSTEQFVEGDYAGKWSNMNVSSLSNSSILHDWSNYDLLEFWVYPAAATNQLIHVILQSDRPDTPQTDYYVTSFRADWAGTWRKITVPFAELAPGNNPAGFEKIDSVRFHNSWSGQSVDPNTVLYLDEMSIRYSSSVLESFELENKWTNLSVSNNRAKSGRFAGLWSDMTKPFVSTDDIPHDWSAYNRLDFWAYAEQATNQQINVLLYSDNPDTPQTDYFVYSFTVNWSDGWRQLHIPFASFASAHAPVGYGQIDRIRLHNSWYGQTVDPNTVLYLDDIRVTAGTTIDEFDTAGQWSNLVITDEQVHSGTNAGKWADMSKTSVNMSAFPHDWSQGNTVSFWVYSANATNQRIQLLLYSNNPATPQIDYYVATFHIDWAAGWRQIAIPYSQFSAAYSPVGWHQIDTVRFHNSWYGQPVEPDTIVYFDLLQIQQSATLDTFEPAGRWSSVSLTDERFIQGSMAGKWSDIDQNKIAALTAIPHDWSDYDRLDFWVYSEEATNQSISVILYSDNLASTQTDYYLYTFRVDWTGWRKLSIPFVQFSPNYVPLGFAQIDSLRFHSSWSGGAVDPDTILYFDDIVLDRQRIVTNPEAVSRKAVEAGATVTYKLEATNKQEIADSFTIVKDETQMNGMTVTLGAPQTAMLAPGEIETLEVSVAAPSGSAGTIGVLKLKLVSAANPAVAKRIELVTTALAPISKAKPHPNVWVSEADIDAAKLKVQQEAWADDYADELIGRADAWLTRDITVPSLAAGHSSFYVCPSNQDVGLTYDPESPHAHYCRIDGQYYTGEYVDAGWRYHRYRELVEAAKLLGIVYALTEREPYAERSRDILAQMADWYGNFPRQSRNGTITWTPLAQSTFLTDLAQAYDLIYRSSAVSDDDKFHIEMNLLKPAVEAVRTVPYTEGVSNSVAWYNAAFVSVGAAIHDTDLIDHGINGPFGFLYQMANSVLDDGTWYEGSPAYHAYALQAQAILVETAYRNGYNLYANSQYKAMLDALIDYTYPNLQLPTINDGGTYGFTWLSDMAALDMEVPYARLGEPQFAWVLDQKYRLHGMPRRGLFSLFHGVSTIPPTSFALSSVNLGSVNDASTGAGLGILRNGSMADAAMVFVDYGPFGYSHGHYDKLHLDLFGSGKPLAPDLGTSGGYSSPYFRDYYKTTLGHNTVVVGEANQKRGSDAGEGAPEVSGTMELFSTQYPAFQVMKANANPKDPNNRWGGAYEGTIYERTVALTPDYALDLFYAGLASGDAERTYDYVMHGLGSFSSSLTMAPRASWSSSTPGYKYLSDPVSATTSGGLTWNAEWTRDSTRLKLTMLDQGTSEVIRALGPGVETMGNEPILLARKTGTAAAYAAILESYDGSIPIVASASRIDDRRLHVELAAGDHDYIYYEDPAALPTAGSLAYGYIRSADAIAPSFAATAVSDGELHIAYMPPASVQHAVHVFHGEGVTEVYLNGIRVPYERSGSFIVVDCG